MASIDPTKLVEIINIDYETLLQESLAIKNKYENLVDWDMGNLNDPLGVILEAYLRAIVKDAYFANVLAQEFSMGTALTKDAVFEKAFFSGYSPTLRTAASCLMDLSIKSGTAYTIEPYKLVLKGSNTSGGTVYFENQNQIVLPISLSDITLTGVSFLEGKSKVTRTTGKGTPFESRVIQDSVIDGTVVIKVNGITWDEVFSIREDTSSTELVYELRHLGNNTYQIIVGDGVNGSLIPEGADVSIRYRSGQGSEGNVLTYYLDTIFSTPSSRVTEALSQFQTDKSSGGQDLENIEKVRTLAPKLSKLYGSLGNIWDMDIYVNSYAGVGVAKTEEFGMNFFRVYLANEVGTPTDSFLSTLKSDIESRLIRNTSVDIVKANKVSVNLDIRVIYDVSYNKAEIETRIQNNLEKFLNPFVYSENQERKLTFGTDLLTSDVYEEVATVKGVIGLAINSPIPYSNIVLVNVSSTSILTNQGSTFTLNMIASTDSTDIRASKTEKWFLNNPKYR